MQNNLIIDVPSASLEKNVALTYLALSGNRFKNIPNFANFDKNIALTHLYVGNNRISLWNLQGRGVNADDFAATQDNTICPKTIFSCQSQCSRMCPLMFDASSWLAANVTLPGKGSKACVVPCDTTTCSPARGCN